MGDSNELIGVALTVAVALAVGLTSASSCRDSSVVESSGETTQMRMLVDKVVQALALIGQQVVSDAPQAHPEIMKQGSEPAAS